MASEPPVCPRCGNPVAAGQDTCIECGARLGGRSLPVGWLVPALAALAVAATAAAVVLAIGRDDGARTVMAPPLTAATTAATAPPRTTPPAVSTARIHSNPTPSPPRITGEIRLTPTVSAAARRAISPRFGRY